jgi:hypothetical protein
MHYATIRLYIPLYTYSLLQLLRAFHNHCARHDWAIRPPAVFHDHEAAPLCLRHQESKKRHYWDCFDLTSDLFSRQWNSVFLFTQLAGVTHRLLSIFGLSYANPTKNALRYRDHQAINSALYTLEGTVFVRQDYETGSPAVFQDHEAASWRRLALQSPIPARHAWADNGRSAHRVVGLC